MLGQGTGRGRTTLWPLGGQRANVWQWPTSWTGLTQPIPNAFKEWALADVAPGRLVPWLPVAFGSGIALYFAAEREPSAWAAAALVLA
ncbi:MAG TPA: competence protein ComEC, partial [Verrucomicrobiae bacterium]|nr:competence protein ComEC [Verrucomicrobiae bacterium]